MVDDDVLGNNHLGKRHAIEDWPDISLVVEGNVVEDNTLTIVEANMELPVLPL